jgi:hypothetical protein
MAAITVQVDVSDADKLCAGAQRQLPYAISRAINATANDLRDTMRQEVMLRFMVRAGHQAFIQKSIQVKSYSDKSQAVIAAEVGTGFPGGRDLLGKFEAGGQKRMVDPYAPPHIPTPTLRRSPASNVPQAMYPSTLGLVPVRTTIGVRIPRWHKTASGKLQIKGARRTFVIGEPGADVWGVFQRTGKRTIHMIWLYRQMTPVPARLGFVKTAESVVATRWPPNFEAAFAQALATAR